jgi:hypothetical protein
MIGMDERRSSKKELREDDEKKCFHIWENLCWIFKKAT